MRFGDLPEKVKKRLRDVPTKHGPPGDDEDLRQVMGHWELHVTNLMLNPSDENVRTAHRTATAHAVAMEHLLAWDQARVEDFHRRFQEWVRGGRKGPRPT